MAKKKNTSKKHKFKHVDTASLEPAASPSNITTETNGSTRPEPAPAPRRAAAISGPVSARDFSYVSGDLRRIAILGGSLIALELVLYYVLVHTAVGATVYSLVRV